MINIVQLYKDYKIKYWDDGPNVSPGWCNIRCVHCEDDSNHLGFNLDKGYFNCWKCGVHDVDYTLSKLLNINKAIAKNIILDYTESFSYIKQLNRKKASAEEIKLPGSELSKYHRKYLQDRNFDPDYLIKEYGITGTDPGETWNGMLYELRLIIPIIYKGQLVSFQGRDITDKQKERYKGCSIEESVINYKHILYNIDRALSDRVVVVEGMTDVWKMGDGFVASFGTIMTSSQIQSLSTFQKIFFLFDPDTQAQRQANKYACQLASMGRDVEVLNNLSGKDPGDMSEKEAEEIRREIL